MLLCPWDFQVKNTGVGCHFLLQGIFPTPGIESRSPSLQMNSLPAEPPGKPSYLFFKSLPVSEEESLLGQG